MYGQGSLRNKHCMNLGRCNQPEQLTKQLCLLFVSEASLKEALSGLMAQHEMILVPWAYGGLPKARLPSAAMTGLGQRRAWAPWVR